MEDTDEDYEIGGPDLMEFMIDEKNTAVENEIRDYTQSVVQQSFVGHYDDHYAEAYEPARQEAYLMATFNLVRASRDL